MTGLTLPDGRVVDASPLAFEPMTEPWCELLLEDGTRLRVKLVVTGVYRLEGEVDEEGSPVYATRSQNLQTVISG